MASSLSRQLQLVAYHDSRVERPNETTESNDDTVEPITVILVQEPKSVASQQSVGGCEPEKKLDNLKNQNVISRVFLLPSTLGSGSDTAYSLMVKVDTEAWRTSHTSAPIEQPHPRYGKLWSFFSTSRYLPIPSHEISNEDSKRKFHKVWIGSIITSAGLLSLLALILVFAFPSAPLHNISWPEEGYIRYSTPGSDGPKRQLRILYHNATEWSQKNPHDNGEWKIRMDDQALIPAAAWDPEEDRYQAWFHDRYKVMSTAVKERSFIRPSWLGSLHMIVPWDDEFHLAHCVVTLKRYWKAKETGKHVCPRDIAPNHIEHCLNWFEGYVFRPEPQLPKMGSTMAWQTKVCF
ncbi:DUF3328 domain protein [Fusarium subglutinans]|uniref:DUF3328 domain protein n=1 Tax=Gibberella subglutinans TaxID=42677 RepID=A0A8H5QCP0_GIBSU|nr:DUF3328 domain protein [Fusarium subglutinans]KAF5611496.1 DUF3328 domain protein [Fusarium subglutinans]